MGDKKCVKDGIKYYDREIIEKIAEETGFSKKIIEQPNAGKSTLFNRLTDSRQHVGNCSGKTVEKKKGYFL